MEMPVPCSDCQKWIDLDETRTSPYDKKLKCQECYQKDSNAYEIYREAYDIQCDLDCYAEHMKGDRRGWKKNLKVLKNKLNELGYDYEEFTFNF